MSRTTMAVTETSHQFTHKSKPRYTEAENKVIFESWWNPQKRRELKSRLGREMNALRSQFCRLLKEKNLTNQEYYQVMQSKHCLDSTDELPKNNTLKEIDRTILEIFCKHQALGNSRLDACNELQKIVGSEFTPAALKLRFYRLIKIMQYSEDDLIHIGKELINNQSIVTPSIASIQPIKSPLVELRVDDFTNSVVPMKVDDDKSFFYQISALPNTVRSIEERLTGIEDQQRRQLDLRGFIEHLLAVERDLKREDKLMEEIQRLITENDNTRIILEKERERLKKREEELAEVYRILETMLGDFMRLESVSKLASLGDFMHRLEITVDQFGNVLKSKRVVS